MVACEGDRAQVYLVQRSELPHRRYISADTQIPRVRWDALSAGGRTLQKGLADSRPSTLS